MTRIVIDRKSPAYQRVTSAGFSIGVPFFRRLRYEIFRKTERDTYTLECIFTCVCGRKERVFLRFPVLDFMTGHFENYNLRKKNSQVYIWDLAQELEDNGAVSVEHLKNDGYTDEQIKEIRKAYEI